MKPRERMNFRLGELQEESENNNKEDCCILKKTEKQKKEKTTQRENREQLRGSCLEGKKDSQERESCAWRRK